eukprot:g6031.t1
MPLHIFEPRYVQMITHALDSSGQIAMAMFAGDRWKHEYHGLPPVRPAACVGQIVQHERMDDGRYNILLQGVCRARIEEERPPDDDHQYRRVRLDPVETQSETLIDEGLERLRDWIEQKMTHGALSRVAVAEQVVEYVRNEDVPTPVLMELVSFAMITEPGARYRLLAEGDVLHPSLLETFPSPTETPFVVEHVNEEFTSVCPKTGHPDFGEITVRFQPGAAAAGGTCVELKSLKLYFQSFRAEGIFYEAVTNQVRDDLVACMNPAWLQVITNWRGRGGIRSIIRADHGDAPEGFHAFARTIPSPKAMALDYSPPAAMRSQLGAHARMLDAAGQAARLDRCDFELQREQGTSMPLPHMSFMHMTFRLLLADARRLSLESEPDAAAQRIATMLGIARHLSMDLTHVSSRIACQAAQAACEHGAALLEAHELSNESKGQLRAAIDRFDPKDPFNTRAATIATVEYAIANSAADLRDREFERIGNTGLVGIDAIEEPLPVTIPEQQAWIDTQMDQCREWAKDVVAAMDGADPDAQLRAISQRARTGEYGLLAKTGLTYSLTPRIEGAFSIANTQIGTKKNGEPYLRCLIGDKTGQVPGRKWTVDENLIRRLPADGFIWLEGETQAYQGELQIIVHVIDPLDPSPEQMRELLPASKRDPKDMFAEVVALLGTLEHPAMKALAQTYLDDEFLMDQFRTAPAAKTMHHAYLGGLCEHTLNLMNLTNAICPLYPKINRDLVMMGLFLHDLGKTRELVYDRGFMYSDRGELIGHIVEGAIMLHDKAQQMMHESGQRLPAGALTVLQHIILSHHGVPEYGAAKIPSTPEAIFVSMLDNLDAKTAIALDAARPDRASGMDLGGNFTERQWALDTKLYKPDPLAE